jgi:hypothetical protein
MIEFSVSMQSFTQTGSCGYLYISMCRSDEQDSWHLWVGDVTVCVLGAQGGTPYSNARKGAPLVSGSSGFPGCPTKSRIDCRRNRAARSSREREEPKPTPKKNLPHHLTKMERLVCYLSARANGPPLHGA